MVRLSSCIGMMDEGIGRVREAIPNLPLPQAGMARLLLLVGSALQAELEGKLKPQRLNDSEFFALMILFGSPDGSSTPGELCEYTSQGPTNMTRIANALVQRKLITRGASEQDRRRVVLHITAEGRRFVRKMLPTLFPRLGMFFEGFSRGELDAFNRLLRKLADNIDHMNGDARP